MTGSPRVVDRNAILMRAREQRRRPSLPESLLWQALRRRDHWLQDQGFRVIRFSALEVMNDLDSVVTAITLACRR